MVNFHVDHIEIDGMRIPYGMAYSRRRTLSIEITNVPGQGTGLLVRAPLRMKQADIEAFIISKEQWISEKYQMVLVNKSNRECVPRPDYMTDAWVQTEGMRRFQVCIDYWADRMATSYGRVTIRDQRTRWGSCSSNGNLNFNWRLLMMPQEIMDYVVVHELAHRREMNHSDRFWQIVGTYIPDYTMRRKWLKENGSRYTE